ncbi:MAG TPA: hypothetical protein VGP06_05215, partial [Janthinobacterium sp.]|nr:hypothetical protein [Janthinobacterium sp.]
GGGQFHGGGHFHGGFHSGYHGGFQGRHHGGFHHGGRVGIFFGGPAYWHYGPGWYGNPYYYYPPVVVQPVAPPVYVERGPQGAVVPSSMWYYCDNPQGYYPYVKQCSSAWRPVAPDSVPPQGG